MYLSPTFFFFFFFNDTATTEIYTLSLHDALPISGSPGLAPRLEHPKQHLARHRAERSEEHTSELRHSQISYAVFCLKKKKKKKKKISIKKKNHITIDILSDKYTMQPHNVLRITDH